jgi:hypothetical protein
MHRNSIEEGIPRYNATAANNGKLYKTRASTTNRT